LGRVLSLEPVDASSIDLPKVVPIISLRNRVTHVWDIIDVEAVIVPFTEFMYFDDLDRVLSRGIHSYLNYDGKIILSSIMPDKYLVEDEVFKQFINVAVRGGFDAVIGWDVPVYIDYPKYYSWINLLKGLELTYELCKTGIPVIALLKGNNTNQISFSINMLMKMGVKNYGLHATEYMYWFKVDPQARTSLYKYGEEVRGRIDNLLVIGALNPSHLKLVQEVFSSIEKLSIAGYSYYLDAEKFKAYFPGRTVDVKWTMVECKCPICKSHPPLKLSESIELRTRHNLNYLKTLLNGGKAYPYEVYDLILSKDETALIASDIHIGTPESMFKQFIDKVKIEKPNHLILLGDIFDLRYGDITLHEVAVFFSTLASINCYVHVVSGCCDSNLNSLLKVMDKLAFEGKYAPATYKKIKLASDIFLKEYFLNFYRFYRQAREKLTIKLPNQITMTLIHGHQVVENPKEKLENIVELLREYKQTLETDWLVIGHIHRAFIDYESELAAVGCWQQPPDHLLGTVKPGDVMRYMYIDGEGNIKLM